MKSLKISLIFVLMLSFTQFVSAFFENKKDMPKQEVSDALHTLNVEIVKNVIREKAKTILNQTRDPQALEKAFNELISAYPQYLGKWCDAQIKLPSGLELIARYLNPSFQVDGVVSSGRYCDIFFKNIAQ